MFFLFTFFSEFASALPSGQHCMSASVLIKKRKFVMGFLLKNDTD